MAQQRGTGPGGGPPGSDRQTVPVRLWESENHVMLSAPMPGLEPEDISVTISGTRVTLRGQRRGPAEPDTPVLKEEWTVGPYYREVELPRPVNGPLSNALYGNGVLVLAMPSVTQGQAGVPAEFGLQVTAAPRGERIGHTGRERNERGTRRQS